MNDSRMHGWQSGAIASRTLLAMFVIFGMVVFFLPTSPLGSRGANAQTTASPSGTGPAINFLNPSGHSKVISDKQEAGASSPSYHLVAWVRNAPANAWVEFKYQVGTGIETTIGTVTAPTSPTNDTFELNWNINDNIPDGAITLKAILFANNGATEVARDEETATMNQAGDAELATPGNERAETVEMTYPVNAGSLGWYNNAAVIDVIFPATGAKDSTTGQTPGPDSIKVYYTKTQVGIEPSWTQCGSESVADAADGVRCTLTGSDTSTMVTAVAAAAVDLECRPPTPGAPANLCQTDSDPATAGDNSVVDSGDAHRVTNYTQVATTVSVSPASQRVDTPLGSTTFPCTSAISVQVKDQNGRKIAAHNVDVHASGPTDQLQFDASTQSDTRQPPNSNHSSNEPAYMCNDNSQTTAANGQAQHEVANAPDLKHIESAAQGTKDDGIFRFKLHSDSAGDTQFTAYADKDDNDLRCSGEPSASGSIGWNKAAPSISGFGVDQSTCPTGSASPSASSSTTSTPTASSSSSSSASPSSSSSPTTSRTVTLATSEADVPSGETTTLSGQIVSSVQACEDNEFIRIQRRVHGTDTFENFRSVNSDSDGNYQATFEVNASADFRAFAPGHDNCAEETSESVTVLARVIVSITVSEFRPERGDRVRFTGKVEPNHHGTKVVLQRKKNGVWVKVKRDTLNAQSRYSFSVLADWRRDRLFRVKWIQGDEDHEVGRSQKVKVTTHR